nr:capsid protein [Cressdnaviricota sp.]
MSVYHTPRSNRSSYGGTPLSTGRAMSRLLSEVARSATRAAIRRTIQFGTPRTPQTPTQNQRRRSAVPTAANAPGFTKTRYFNGGKDTKYVKRRKLKNKNGKKGVKISRSFRKKVQIATEDKKPEGLAKEYYFQKYPYSSTDNNTQVVSYMPGGTYFTPDLFNDAASKLWNGKTPAPYSSKTTVGNFGNESLDLFVNNSYVHHTIRNNSHRAYHIKFYECKPKKNNSTLLNTDPVANWTQGLIEGTFAVASSGYWNVTGVTPQTLHTTPGLSPQFKEYWSYTTTTITLQPGETHAITTQGPKDYMLKYSKFYNGQNFVNNQPFTRYCFISYYPDLVGARFTVAAASAGYYAGSAEAATGTHGLLVESKLVYSLRLPEVTGGISSAAGVLEVNDFRRNAFAINSYHITETPVELGRIDDEQPATDEPLTV